MRKLMALLLMVVLLTPVMGSAVPAGDPLDTNDGDVADYYCSNYDGVSSPFEDWSCDMAMQQEMGGWWDWPW